MYKRQVLVSLAPGASLPLGPTDALSPLTVPSITGAAMADYVGAGEEFMAGFNTFTATAFTGGGGNVANPQQTTAARITVWAAPKRTSGWSVATRWLPSVAT